MGSLGKHGVLDLSRSGFSEFKSLSVVFQLPLNSDFSFQWLKGLQLEKPLPLKFFELDAQQDESLLSQH